MLVGFFTMLANLSALVFVALLVVEVNELSSSAAGLVLTPGAVALAILPPLAGRLSDRVGVRPPIVAGLVMMALALLYISTFAGAPPVLIAGGVRGLGVGFACIQSPTKDAAANALRKAAVGPGMGLFAGAFFLGSGTGPALIGAFLAARQEAGFGALNPLNRFDAAPFSDAFLVMAVAVVIALLATFGLRSHTKEAPPMT